NRTMPTSARACRPWSSDLTKPNRERPSRMPASISPSRGGSPAARAAIASTLALASITASTPTRYVRSGFNMVPWLLEATGAVLLHLIRVLWIRRLDHVGFDRGRLDGAGLNGVGLDRVGLDRVRHNRVCLDGMALDGVRFDLGGFDLLLLHAAPVSIW